MQLRRLYPLTALLLALVASPAKAEWKQYAAGESYSWHYELPFIKREGPTRTFWIVKNLSAIDEHERMSYRFLVQLNCKSRKYRYLTVRGFDGAMGEGKLLGFDDKLGPWVEISPQTLKAHLEDHICRMPE